MSTVKVNLVEPRSGTTLTLGASGDTVDIPSGVTIANSGTATGFGGLSNASIWRVTSDFTNDAQPIASNWETADTYGAGTLGSAMTESSGIFTFPSTGFWLVMFNANCQGGATNYTYNFTELRTTLDNSNYNVVSQAQSNMDNAASAGTTFASATAWTIFDVTSTTLCKVRFDVRSSATSNTTWQGATDENRTYAMFMRLGDT